MNGRNSSSTTVGKEHGHAVSDRNGDRTRGVGGNQGVGRLPGCELVHGTDVDHAAAVDLSHTDDAASLDVQQFSKRSEAVGDAGRPRAKIARGERMTGIRAEGLRCQNSTRRRLDPDEPFGNFRCRHWG
jgi:hypothetical protein